MKLFTAFLYSFLALSSLMFNIQAQQFAWAKNPSGASSKMATSVVTDAAGNVYITGVFSYFTAIFGEIELNSNGEWDIFLAKYDPNGNVIWAKSAGGGSYDMASSVTTDPAGNVYLTGSFWSSTITFGNFTLTNNSTNHLDFYIVKYNSSGEVLWAKSAVGTNDDGGNSVSADNAGNIYVAVEFNSPSITFGNITINNTVTNLTQDVVVVKYDSAGNVIWAKSGSGVDYDQYAFIKTDDAENIYLTGLFDSPTIKFGDITLQGFGGLLNLFIVKFDSSGNALWGKSAEGLANSLSADAAGNTYITGLFNNTITFGDIILTSTGGNDIFIVKYDSNGNVIWAKSAGGTDYDEANSLASDAEGNVYVTGNFNSTEITFGSITVQNANNGSYDLFIVKYDSSGNAVWVKSAGGSGYEKATSVSVDAFGNTYIAGTYFSPLIKFGSITLNNSGNPQDMFLAKISPNITGVSSEKITLPKEYALWNNYPNPFNPVTTIKYTLPKESSIRLTIYNSLGEEVIELVSGVIPTGTYEEKFNASGLSSGRYFYTITARSTDGRDNYTKTNKMILLK